MKIGIITNETLAQFLIKTFEKINYKSYWISGQNKPLKILKEFKDCNIIYALAPFEIKIYLLAKMFRKKIITHWIGSDALQATTYLKYKFYAKICNLLTDKQLVVSPNIKNEIEGICIKRSEVVPILPKFTSKKISRIEQKNSQFTVLSYIPTNNFDFYGGNEILKLVKDCPDINFWILTLGKSKESNLRNLKYLEFVSPARMNTIYNKCHVLIRYVQHDGFPKMILEAMQKGLQVVYSFPFPFTHHCTSLEQIKEILYELKNNYQINSEGRSYVLKNFCPKANVIMFQKILKEVVEC